MKFRLKAAQFGRGYETARSDSEAIQYTAIVTSGGGTCRNRALGDTFLKFGMVLEQAMRFSKTTGYCVSRIEHHS